MMDQVPSLQTQLASEPIE